MHVELVDPYSPRVEATWRALEATSPPSFFLSWGWIENWLAVLPRDRAPRFALIDGGAAACFLGLRTQLRHKVIATRGVHLNATGDSRLDKLWIEYNDVLGQRIALDALLDALPRGWDEVKLPGLAADAFGGLSSRYRVLRREVPSYRVDLAKVRARGYLSLLSGQTRSQLRRARKAAGDFTMTVARDPAEAIDIYDELAALHAAQWRAKGAPGAFADPWFDRFHRRLVAQRFADGEIQLVRVRAGAHTVGCLYNFIWRGNVLQYQGGLATYEDSHQKPGYVCHAAAVEHAAAHGLAVYDFLGGEVRYKKSLSTDSVPLVWATVQRTRLRFAFEDRALAAWRARRR